MSEYSFAGTSERLIYVNFRFDIQTKAGGLEIKEGDKVTMCTYIEFDLEKIEYKEHKYKDSSGKEKTAYYHKLLLSAGGKKLSFSLSIGKGYWRSLINALCSVAAGGLDFNNLRIDYSVGSKGFPNLWLSKDGEDVRWFWEYKDLPDTPEVPYPNGQTGRDYKAQNKFFMDKIKDVLIPALSLPPVQKPQETGIATPSDPVTAAAKPQLPPDVPPDDGYEDDLPF